MNSDGKYGNYSSTICTVLDAEAVIVVVRGGRVGDGFSVSVKRDTNVLALCKAMRVVIDQMEADYAPKH